MLTLKEFIALSLSRRGTKGKKSPLVLNMRGAPPSTTALVVIASNPIIVEFVESLLPIGTASTYDDEDSLLILTPYTLILSMFPSTEKVVFIYDSLILIAANLDEVSVFGLKSVPYTDLVNILNPIVLALIDSS